MNRHQAEWSEADEALNEQAKDDRHAWLLRGLNG
jgi:hypothetical protein